MLLNATTYQQLKKLQQSQPAVISSGNGGFLGLSSPWNETSKDRLRALKMLLIHQTGAVKVGEVIRYTVTYTPSLDRILPIPSTLFVRVKNTSAIPLRAAYLHGPYTLYTACYPADFDPNKKTDQPKDHGAPSFEGNLKAGGSWGSSLRVPEHIRSDQTGKTITWIVEVASQIIFSTSAQVHFEMSVGRDEKSLNMGIAGVLGSKSQMPHHDRRSSGDGQQALPQKGVYSKSIDLKVEDTIDLWSKPEFPGLKDIVPNTSPLQEKHPELKSPDGQPPTSNDHKNKPSRTKKVHLVVITHGLHSNTGADMLFLKESIDAAAKQAKVDAKARRAAEKKSSTEHVGSEYDDNDEEVIVRGYSGNAVRTEKGIKFLGKRLAKYILSITFPSQPFLPIKRQSTMSKTLSFGSSSSSKQHSSLGLPAHSHSTIRRGDSVENDSGYQVTSISFVGHSLGGLIQTYAIGYIQKHSPTFFEEIRPINFIAMASPFLGLSNENPIYVKFALDFGLVGRTGQDLGLTWRAPNIARSGWDAMVGGIGSTSGRRTPSEEDPEAKPLLRILPTGPAHQVLRKFRNRTLYSNVVNDGIVPLRTSCLLFLDWQGLGRVEKARRENGLVGTMVGWGWAEMTGANSTDVQRRRRMESDDIPSNHESSEDESNHISGHGIQVPQPAESATKDDNAEQAPSSSQFLHKEAQEVNHQTGHRENSDGSSFMSGFWSFFSPHRAKQHPQVSPKSTRIYKRSQTVHVNDGADGSPPAQTGGEDKDDSTSNKTRPKVTRGDTQLEESSGLFAPPRTTVFESAGDILSPPIPSDDYIMDPQSRPRTIFHDRVYHADDIPPPPVKARPSSGRSTSSQGELGSNSRQGSGTYGSPSTTASLDSFDSSGMKVEERIARAYHRNLAWRKVLVRLEPDAHNNMVVRRMFSNAYGWPVVKHLCDTHFADTYVARTKDALEPSDERSKTLAQGADNEGSEVSPPPPQMPKRTDSEIKEADDELSALRPRPPAAIRSKSSAAAAVAAAASVNRDDSGHWSDHYFEVTDDDDDTDQSTPTTPLRPLSRRKMVDDPAVDPDAPRGTSDAEIAAFLTASPVEKPGGFSGQSLNGAVARASVGNPSGGSGQVSGGLQKENEEPGRKS